MKTTFGNIVRDQSVSICMLQFPNILIDLEQLVPVLLEEKDLYILLLISEYILFT